MRPFDVDKLESEIKFLKSKLGVMEEILNKVSENCPNCANEGLIIIGETPGEPEPCEWCYTTPYSKFNIEKVISGVFFGLVPFRGEDKDEAGN